MMRARWIRVSIYVASSLAALTAVIGLLHTPLGRPLLARMGVGCPVQASPEDAERARLESARATRGTEASPTRPALGFVLDKMTIEDAQAWAEREHVSCDAQRNDSLLRCTDVPERALSGRTGSPLNELDLAFSPRTKQLVNIATTQYDLSSAAAAEQMNAVVAGLEDKLGKPTHETGRRSSAYLAAAPMRTALVRYRFTNYQADVAATNFPGRGTVLREHYMSASD